MPNIEIKPKEITSINIINNDAYSLPTGKMYQPEIKKVEDNPDDIPEDYDDFVNEEEIKKIEEEKKQARKQQLLLQKQQQQQKEKVKEKEKEAKIQPVIQQVPEGKRKQTLDRIKDLKDVINIESEDFVLFQFDFINEKDDSNNANKIKEEIGVNTDIM